MSAYDEGFKKGLEDGKPGKDIDSYWLSRFEDAYRVGYVLGFGESAYVGVPPDYRYVLIGRMAERSSGVPLSLFERHHRLSDEAWKDFVKGYKGDQDDDLYQDDDGEGSDD